MSRDTLSSDSIAQASKGNAEFSGHGDAAGIAGYQEGKQGGECDYLSGVGQTKVIERPENGFSPIHIGLSWNNIITEQETGFFKKLVKKATKQGVDLDLGCLYELKNGERGCIQAFGDKFGDFDDEPYISLSGDERTGDAEGDDEIIRVNSDHWDEIERILVYCYIYDGPNRWADIAPQLTIKTKGCKPIRIAPTAHKKDINICALAKIRHEQSGMHFTNHTEYFHDHAAMDRAYGFGIQWGEGHK